MEHIQRRPYDPENAYMFNLTTEEMDHYRAELANLQHTFRLMGKSGEYDKMMSRFRQIANAVAMVEAAWEAKVGNT